LRHRKRRRLRGRRRGGRRRVIVLPGRKKTVCANGSINVNDEISG
jgi:hypothetical protein